jgi:hypothetical protein
VRDGDALSVGDRGEGDVLGIKARLEDRAQARIAVEGLVRIGACRDNLPRPVEDGHRQQFRARLTFVEAHAREPRQVHQAQHDHNRPDDGGDAENLFALDA